MHNQTTQTAKRVARKRLTSIASRVTAAIAVAAFVVLATGGVLFYKQVRHNYLAEFDYRGTIAADQLELDLIQNNGENAEEAILNVMRNKEVYGASVLLPNNHLLFTRDEQGKPVPSKSPPNLGEHLKTIERQFQLSTDQKMSIAVYQSMQSIQPDLRRILAMAVLFTFCLIVILVIVLFAILWVYIFHPMALMTQYANNFNARNLDESAKAIDGIPAEFKLICDTVNEVVSQLKEQVRETHNANYRFKLVTRKFPMPLGIYNPNTGRAEYINEQFTETFGYELEDIPTVDIWYEKAFPDPIYRQRMRDSWVSKLASAKDIIATIDPLERKITCKNGDIRYVLVGGIAVEKEFIVGIFFDITDQKNAQNEVMENRSRLRELTAHIQDVREEERKRVAQELHDELGQLLTVARIDLANLAEKAPKGNNGLCEGFKSQMKILNEASDSARRLSENLRPGMLDLLGLAAAIELHVKRFTEATNIAVELDIGDPDSLDLEDRVATTAFRIIQESLTNVARYAEASHVHIYVDNLGAELLIVIKDNGVGFDKNSLNNKRGFGLLGMRERAEILGGNICIDTAPQQGVRIEASIPITQPDENNHD